MHNHNIKPNTMSWRLSTKH